MCMKYLSEYIAEAKDREDDDAEDEIERAKRMIEWLEKTYTGEEKCTQ